MEDNGPVGIEGRKYLEDGIWVWIFAGGDKFMAKLEQSQLAKALMGERFEAWHILSPGQGGKSGYMPAIIGAMEPWYFDSRQCQCICLMHPDKAAVVNDGLRKMIDGTKIQEVRATDPMLRNVNMDHKGFRKL